MTKKESVTYESDPREPISVGLVRAVAVLKKPDPMDLPPLYEIVDPEALDALVESRTAQPHRVRLL